MTHAASLTPIAFAGCAALLAACSSVETRVDTGPIEAGTFAFVARTTPPPPSADDAEQVHAAIQDAITKNLAARGLRRVTAAPDVMVAYLVIVGDSASTRAVDAYFGRGRPYGELHGKAHEAYTSQANPGYVEAGTLLIDVLDGHTAALLERNFATRPILRDPSPEVRAANVQSAVDEALAGLRIAP